MFEVLKSHFENKLKCLKIALKYTHTHRERDNHHIPDALKMEEAVLLSQKMRIM